MHKLHGMHTSTRTGILSVIVVIEGILRQLTFRTFDRVRPGHSNGIPSINAPNDVVRAVIVAESRNGR